jgi:Bacterial SH3 domain
MPISKLALFPVELMANAKTLVFVIPAALTVNIFLPSSAQAGCTTYGSSIVVDCSPARFNPHYPKIEYQFPKPGVGSPQNFTPASAPSPTYTTSNPSTLSLTPSFQVSKGMPVLVKTNGGVLNVRSNAGLTNPVIGTFTNQTKVMLSGLQQEGWVQLETGGWVHSDYLTSPL